MQLREYRQGKVIMGRLPKGEDLLTAIEQAARENDIKMGKVELIGAVERAVIAFYDQDEYKYKNIEINRPMEIVSTMGNISQKDGDVKAHIHITLGDADGSTYSGHLAQGTVIFASEIVVQELQGPQLHRGYDEPTGLPLWDME